MYKKKTPFVLKIQNFWPEIYSKHVPVLTTYEIFVCFFLNKNLIIMPAIFPLQIFCNLNIIFTAQKPI